MAFMVSRFVIGDLCFNFLGSLDFRATEWAEEEGMINHSWLFILKVDQPDRHI